MKEKIKIFILYIAVLIAMIFYSANVNAQSLLFEETFENTYGSTPTWLPVDQTVPKQYLNSCHAIENNGYPEALQNVFHAGTNAGRWHLDKLEPLFQGSTYRTEVTIVKATEDVRCTPEMWYHFRVLFPTDSASSDTRKTSINQWFEDGSDELTLRTQYGRCFMELQSAAGEYRWDIFSGATTFNNTSVASFAFHPLDQWDDVTFNINHQLGSTGFIKVYRNGVLIHTYNGPTIHSIRPKWKIGIYSSQTSSSVPYKAIYFDNIRVGNNNSNLEEMEGSTPPANLPPLSNAGSDQTITLPTSSVSLIGTASSDPDGTITTYAWTKISGGSATITSASSANTTVTGLVQGTYVFRLTVTDNGGATDFDDVTITVNPVPNAPPVAAAGADQTITLPTSSVSLNGSGSTDSDGTITTYAWTKISGTGGTITTPASSSTTVTGLTAGSYTFRLTVTDNSGATATDNVVITVLPAPNVPPVANAGADQSITLPTSSVTVNGGSSTDADGTIVTYAWTKISGGAATITSPSSSSTTITGLVAGTYSFRLTVTDNSGATGTDAMVVIVNPAPNVPPVANAGTDQSITLPTSSVTLNGSGSTDSDGTITTYAWVKISGTGGTITSPSSSSTTVAGLTEGTYSFRLTVTDNSGATHSDLMQVIVNPAIPPPNIAPVAVAGADQSIQLPTSTATLNGTASSDADGTIVTYAWTKLSGPSVSITSPSSATTGLTALVAGTYVFTLTVTDDGGSTGTDNVQIIVLPVANVAPVADAGSNITITLPTSSTTLNGSSSTDSDGSIASYAWTKLSGMGGSITSPSSASTGVTGLTEGTYTYQLVVTDDDGATSTDNVTVTVLPAPNSPPTAGTGSNITIVLPTSTTTLTATSSTDSDGTIVSYLWERISGPVGSTIASPNSITTTVTGLQEGVYTFRLTVTDDDGLTGITVIQVTVQAAPIAQVGEVITTKKRYTVSNMRNGVFY